MRAHSSAWIEWLPAEQLVEGSSPSGPVLILSPAHCCQLSMISSNFSAGNPINLIMVMSTLSSTVRVANISTLEGFGFRLFISLHVRIWSVSLGTGTIIF